MTTIASIQKDREEKRAEHVRCTPTTHRLAARLAKQCSASGKRWSLTDVVEAAVRLAADSVKKNGVWDLEEARIAASRASIAAREAAESATPQRVTRIAGRQARKPRSRTATKTRRER